MWKMTGVGSMATETVAGAVEERAEETAETVAGIVRTWVAGWAVSRATPTPVEKPWGLYVEEPGNPREFGRHVLPEADAALIRGAAESVTTPRTWIKTPAEPEEIAPWAPTGWVVAYEETGHLMATDLATTYPVVPDGYTAEVENRDSVIRVRVLDAAGEPAARGQIALAGEAAIADQIETWEAHRRRGLGQFVMRTLADRAAGAGAALGILAATDAGRALYESLGWKKHAPLGACVYRP
ncbi:GNAT family N-acetyltransferase [Streptomyces varsoviensis]|uniref:GNAT family N-acetyltransferase n=1 Tax=Streptomyces varsoviensis TaxID=67373 RepID=UPI000AFC4B64|nr:GNAT family N-acetyltransferase [Streptomyces varsoviensis]